MTRPFREKMAALAGEGWVVAERGRFNMDLAGRYIVAEPHEPGELEPGDTAPWHVIGDDLEALVDEAFAHLATINDTYATRH